MRRRGWVNGDRRGMILLCIGDCAVDFGGFRGSKAMRWYFEVVLIWSIYEDWIGVFILLGFY